LPRRTIKDRSVAPADILTAEIEDNKWLGELRIEIPAAKRYHFVNRTLMHVALSIGQPDCPASALVLFEKFDSGTHFAGGLAGIHFRSTLSPQ